MKLLIPRFMFGVVMLALLATGCVEQDIEQISTGVDINFVAAQQLESGTYVLGIDYTLYSSDNEASKIIAYVDGEETQLTSSTEVTSSSTADGGVMYLDIDDPGEETHKVYLALFDPSGMEFVSDEKTFATGSRTVLVEIVTSSNCTPCAPANEEYKEATESAIAQNRIATIKYHVWWPRPTDALYLATKDLVKPRVNYLFSPLDPNSAPNGFINGMNASSSVYSWLSQIAIEAERTPGAIITLSTASDNDNSVDLSITVAGISTGNYTDLRLHTVVTESEIEYNDGNAEFIHYDVMRNMLPDQNGEAVSIGNGDTKSFSRTIAIDQSWVRDNMHVVVFLQSEDSKDILQAARISLQ